MATDLDLEALKVGDEVAFESGPYSGGSISLTRVDRFTKTQIITTDGYRWRRDCGRRVGADRGIWSITPYLIDPNSPRVIGLLAYEKIEMLLRTINKTRPEGKTIEAAFETLDKIQKFCGQIESSLAYLDSKLTKEGN